jgi:hypothetical protein
MVGLEMMLKAFGITPEAMQKQIGPLITGIQEFKAQFSLMQAQLNRIEENQHVIMERLNIPQIDHPVMEPEARKAIDYDGLS